MAPIMALIPNIFKATSMNLLFVSTAAKLRSLDFKHSWASLPTKTPFRCGFYLNLHQIDKHLRRKRKDGVAQITPQHLHLPLLEFLPTQGLPLVFSSNHSPRFSPGSLVPSGGL